MTERLHRFHKNEWASPFEPVLGDLREVEDVIRRYLTPSEPYLLPASHHTRETGGKRLRPAAFLLLVRLVGERPSLPHIVCAAVLEFCHTASLLHDDVLDHASKRRGRTSMNLLRGNRETVLYGDHLLAGAFQLLADLARPELLHVVAGLVREVCAGEIRQWAQKSFDLAEEEYLAIVRAKTASFFRFAGTLAGRMACLGRVQTEKLEAWGNFFGTAYQIADDVYDLVAPSRSEKTTGRDAQSGLLTLPWIRLRDRRGIKALRDRYLASTTFSVKSLLDDDPLREAIHEAIAVAEDLLARSQAVLAEFPSSDARRTLMGFAGKLKSKVRTLVGLG